MEGILVSHLNVLVSGATGRMGRTVVSLVAADQSMRLLAALDRPDSESVGVDAGHLSGVGQLGVTIASFESFFSNLSKIENSSDTDRVLVDFSVPQCLEQVLHYCVEHCIPLVTGTTGLNPSLQQTLEDAAQKIPIVQSPNMSIGVNVCLEALRLVADLVGDKADIEIFEAHHKHKRDAPSGTALRMGEVIAERLGRKLSDIAVYDRHGIDDVREEGSIGFSTVRAGGIVGDHRVIFGMKGENLEIAHHAQSRENFALGALTAASWLVNQKRGSGLFGMHDVLFSRE